jgi:hypothetical protein
MVRFGDEMTDAIARCLQTSIALFLSTPFVSDNTTEDGRMWNRSLVVSLGLLNAMPMNLFQACFDVSCAELLDAINATDSEVRKQISLAMQRKLV